MIKRSASTRPQDLRQRSAPLAPAADSKRVVLLASYAPSLLNFRGQLIEEMVARGHQVFALAPGLEGPLEEATRRLGVTPVAVPLSNSTLNPFESVRSSHRIRDVLRDIRPDVVLAYTIKPIVLGAPAAAAARVPAFVALVTGLGFAFTPGREAKRLLSRLVGSVLYRRAFRLSKLVIFQNPDDREDFRRLHLLSESTATALVSGSGVDLDRYKQEPPPAAPSFLMIARLLGDKGVREFAEAARMLKRHHPDVPIVLVGGTFPSPDCLTEKEIEAVRDAGVEMTGAVDDVRPALRDCSVFVLPSYREGTPRTALEALSVGRAIVTTDVPGCRETVVEGENGFLVPPRDPKSLYEAMLRFVEKPGLAAAMGAVSRQIAEEKFDVRKINNRMIELLEL